MRKLPVAFTQKQICPHLPLVGAPLLWPPLGSALALLLQAWVAPFQRLQMDLPEQQVNFLQLALLLLLAASWTLAWAIPAFGRTPPKLLGVGRLRLPWLHLAQTRNLQRALHYGHM